MKTEHTDAIMNTQYSRSKRGRTHRIEIGYSIFFDGETVAISDDQEAADAIVSACNERDLLLVQVKAQRNSLLAAQARLRGEFDHPALVSFGPLRDFAQDDVLAIVGAGLLASKP